MAIPWVTIILTLLSFFLTKAKTGSTSKAVLAAALAGGATYAVTHSDFAADTALAEYDGVVNTAWPVLDETGQQILDANGKPVQAVSGATLASSGTAGAPAGGGIVSSAAGVLTSWGATGTAGVIGATAVATDSKLRKYLPFLIGGAILLIATR